MKLSERLETILSMAEAADCLFDVGCDHAFVSIEAVRRGTALRAAASDVADGPLRAAAEHVREAGEEKRIKTVKSDGLASEELRTLAAEGESRILVISGMGGQLIREILSGARTDSPETVRRFVAGTGQLLLSPQSEPEILRHYLTDEAGFLIRDESWVCDAGQYYVILDVRPFLPAAAYESEADYVFGGCDSKEADPVRTAFLLRTLEKTEKERRLASLGNSEASRERTLALMRKQELLEEKISKLKHAAGSRTAADGRERAE